MPDETPNYVCDRCGYPAIQADGRWVHAGNGDAAMCQIREWAERGRKLQTAINEITDGEP